MNRGLVFGIILAVLFVILHLVIEQGTTLRDFPLWFAQALFYFFGALMAASAQYKKNLETDQPGDEVKNAGRGAAITLCAIMWVYIIVRSVAMNDRGMFASVGIGLSILLIAIDFGVAIALGSLGGSIIYRQHYYSEEE